MVVHEAIGIFHGDDQSKNGKATGMDKQGLIKRGRLHDMIGKTWKERTLPHVQILVIREGSSMVLCAVDQLASD